MTKKEMNLRFIIFLILFSDNNVSHLGLRCQLFEGRIH